MSRLRSVLTATVLAGALSGCGLVSGGVYDTDLPGGADLGSDPVTLTADFSDALDLVPQSSVKVDNVEVGQVTSIDLNPDGRSARVELAVNRSVVLPEGTDARLQQTSLLGEKYVALVRPDDSKGSPTSGARLTDGSHLGVASTSQAAEVEEVLGSLSLVLNGGGVGQFQEISRELQSVSAGRPEEIKAFLRQISTFVSGLDDRKEALTATLDGLDRLGRVLEADKDKIVTAVEDLSPGMQVLVDQREDLVAMLESLDALSAVTVDTLDAAQADIVADFKALEPILAQLAKSGSDLPNALQILLTYPFPDSVLNAIRGDYFNVFISTNFRTPSDCAAFACAWPQPGPSSSAAPAARRGARQQEGLSWEDHPELGTDPGEGSEETRTPAPTLLTPTDTAVPGIPLPSVTVTVDPSESSTPQPTANPTTSSPTPYPASPLPTAPGGEQ